MAPLTVALVLLSLVAGVLVGAWLGRSLTAGHDERELSRAREELANARAEAAVARKEAAEARMAGALADADVAAAVAQRDAAIVRAEEVAADRQAMVDQFRLLSTEVAERQGKAVEAVSAQRLQATERLLAPVAESLKEFQARLGEVEKERVAMASDLRAQVSTVRQAGEAMRREAATLVTALRKPQVRGSWGETTLKNVARLAGMVERCDFDLQVTNQADGQRLRPDMRVNLADGKYVFVDSKVPLSAFLDAAETDDEAQQAAHLASFARHVRTHVDQLSSKQYWKAAESPEFVVLFLPSEAFFSAALDQMPDLYEYAIGKDVVLATPTTLIGMLRAISYGWKQAALAETAREVFRLGRELHERLGQLGNRFDKLGRALGSTVNAYNETIGTVETRVFVSARRFRDLQVSERELSPPERLEAPVRQIQAPELVDDATQVEPLVGRRTRRAPEPPEAETLWRSDPEVEELVEDDADRASTAADDRRHEA
ncbi:MAG TPA: DNA recombination protein RmuC [Nocardioides sp.]|uniref:DNA recombination protein RmuC n=1 Tax=Nocardioides sp. TaxID=35761 RepID=UPI002E35477F|nr:DNA recombination protein RmuC [Nocardioides sp.]HEX5088434.1 DNA recombination protein RmuC [Nocardioides sp.]